MVVFAASVGGHLELLEAIAPVIRGHALTWVTTPGARPSALSDRGEKVHLLTPLDRESFSLLGVLQGAVLAARLRPRFVITSGAGVVASFCVVARLFGARLMFVETMARVDHGSATGRLLYRLADRFLVQWPELIRQYPSAIVCRPALLEDLPAIGGRSGTGTFVSVGSHPTPFKRLLSTVDAAVRSGVIPTPVTAQVGTGDLVGPGIAAAGFITPEAFLERVTDAAVVVCHAGAGVIGTVLRQGKRPLVMARRADLGEHVDDHQRQVVAKLNRLGLIIEIQDEITLETVEASRAHEADPGSAFAGLPSVSEEVVGWLDRGVAPRRQASVSPQPRTVALAWGAHTDRVHELARAVDGEGKAFGGSKLGGAWSAPARWVLNAIRTAAFLIRRRPTGVIVQNPPIFLALVGFAYSSMFGARLVLDSHPTSFGRKNSRIWRALVPLHRSIARRAAAVLVTEDELRREVENWGACGVVIHEAPPDLTALADVTPASDAGSNGRTRVLLVAVFAPDEPVREAVLAAVGLPEVELFVTGSKEKAPPGLIDEFSDRVTFTGFLSGGDYLDALRRADVVLALTTEKTSVMRAAYEAVYARKPLVVSDWPILRETFPYAMFAENTSGAIASALTAADTELDELRSRSDEALGVQNLRWREQRRELRSVLGLPIDGGDESGAGFDGDIRVGDCGQ